ncbi:CRISPR-associated protein Cas5 [Marinilabilia sp.]|uniref:CRISPR-associated protein Cas5 n=1 Tax=Marinilabilia sp. TaxID=2021252 RepID=UPI0025C21E3B|nr:CRISPR-associated protein Cas5 [Marinilabilia sp.]
MEAILLEIKGKWAQFRKAETNNNPLSHDFMTKTAFIGLLGAVIGVERNQMRQHFPLLCDGLVFGLQINNEVQKQSWGFTFRSVTHAWEKAPKQMEFIKDPNYTILLGLKDEGCREQFEYFRAHIKEGKACYPPVLGLHNCPADIKFLESGIIESKQGNFETYGFVTTDYQPIIDNMSEFRIGFDKIPTFQDDNFWNVPERFVSVTYPSNQRKLLVSGEFHEFNKQTQWCLI